MSKSSLVFENKRSDRTVHFRSNKSESPALQLSVKYTRQEAGIVFIDKALLRQAGKEAEALSQASSRPSRRLAERTEERKELHQVTSLYSLF